MVFVAALVLFMCGKLTAQSLSFGEPVEFMPGATTDNAVDITNYKGGFFVSWKEIGKTGKIHLRYLGKQYAAIASQHEEQLSDAQSNFAPVFSKLNGRLYLSWIAADGTFKYIINATDTSFNTQKVYTAVLNAKLTSGVTSAALGNRLMITGHGNAKNQMVYALFDVDADGTFTNATIKAIPNVKSADYPFLVSLNNTSARITYKGFGENKTYYMDYQAGTDAWAPPKSFAKSNTTPAVYHVFDANRLFYIWKGAGDNRLNYATGQKEGPLTNTITLSNDFTTRLPASIATVDDKKFILAFVGTDKKIRLSFFTSYDPASWIEDVFYPEKMHYTLKDIVIPGSHDAGMSVLTATGGQQKGTINECNTLTQSQNIKTQLDQGIRMFDLRIGEFNKELYTKHSSSDCMSEAVGGGYGEKFDDALSGVKQFLHTNNKEFVLLTLTHFCEKEAPAQRVANDMIAKLGKDLVYVIDKPLNEVTLADVAGKAVLLFEGYNTTDKLVGSTTIGTGSAAFVNFRRAYAATNALNKLLQGQQAFLIEMTGKVKNNDLVRLDWQLTQAADEAALVCNDFQDERISPIVNGAILLTNLIRKNKSIRDLALYGNKSLPLKLKEWAGDGTINKKNKPNILYVDMAGAWITDYCVELNKSAIYTK
ncbi:hypothetical protein ACFQZS_18675 [Mucilaginibacter calamicampi]|uniref:1-phosphatidylinositol phosphodiesterase n=2 Tax=Mucilaginibacter calamicampi TaxID=1302352 RepID=A0ABW2Z2V5_9SPHI